MHDHRAVGLERLADRLAQRLHEAILLADHLVIAFPLWWGGEPARMKGFWDRLLLPGRAFNPGEGLIAEGLLAGRSAATLLVSQDGTNKPGRDAGCDASFGLTPIP